MRALGGERRSQRPMREYDVEILQARLDPWRALLEDWHRRIVKYVDAFLDDRGKPTDAPYWYNERASLGVFAGAAHARRDALVLEEYRVTRSEGGAPAPTNGRADLWFQLGTAGHDWRFILEAKQLWPSTARSLASGLAREDSVLASACAQAANVEDDNRRTTRVGVIFAAPSIAEGEDIDTRLEQMRAAAAQTRPDLLAWSFPRAARELVSKLPRTEGRRYPGVFLVGRRATTPARTA